MSLDVFNHFLYVLASDNLRLKKHTIHLTPDTAKWPHGGFPSKQHHYQRRNQRHVQSLPSAKKSWA